MQGVPQPQRVACEQRLVEPEHLAHPRHVGGGGGVAEHDRGGVLLRQPAEHEGDEGGDEQHGERDQQGPAEGGGGPRDSGQHERAGVDRLEGRLTHVQHGHFSTQTPSKRWMSTQFRRPCTLGLCAAKRVTVNRNTFGMFVTAILVAFWIAAG